MYFLNIRRLKDELRLGPLPSRDVVKYVGAQAILVSIVFVPTAVGPASGWDFLTVPLLTLAGVFYCYRSNGGADGVQLAERYLTIGWVVGWRTALVAGASAVAVAAVSGVVAAIMGRDVLGGYMAVAWRVVTYVLIAWVYWRMGVHVGDVSRNGAQAPTPV